MYTCLFAQESFDLRELLRNGMSDEEIFSRIKTIWQNREDRYSEIRSRLSASHQTSPRKVEMFQIGG